MATASVMQDNTNQYATSMHAEKTAQDIVQGIKRDVQCLSDANKVVRRRAVERLIRDTVDKSPPLTKDALSLIYECLYKPVLKLFADDVDRTRELAVNLTSCLCCQVNEPEQYLPYIIPTIHERLGGEEVKESTEEIRLLLVEILSKLNGICGEKVGVYINELVQILQKCILDPFADVRKASCIYTCELSALAPERFYQQGESLIDPLLRSLSHQHNKVRTMVLKTIGVVVLATSGKAVNDVFTHIAQRTFDHSPTVRLMVTEVAGEWILKLRDRYSFFRKLIPLLLSGFSDEMPEIQEKSKEYYKRAGELYEQENESDFKEKKEYLTVKHYEHLIEYERPNLGCRALVQRNFSNILPAIVNDITDWTVATRVKTASLLYWLVLHCEDHVTMNMQMLSQALYKGAQDEEIMVVKETLKTANLVGLFVEPSVYCKLILPHLEANTASSPELLSCGLAVLAAYIQGANYVLLSDEIELICSTLENPDICNVINKKCQDELLNCVDALVSKPGINHSLISCKLFTILLNVFALTSLEDKKEKIRHLMDSLSSMMNFPDRYNLFESYAPEMLSRLKETCADWTSQSSDCFVFISLLSESSRSLVSLLKESIPIFIQCCDTSKDPEMRQKMLTMMSHLVTRPSMDEALCEKFQTYSVQLIKDVILPNCVWCAGRTAAAIRAITVSFLWALLQSHIVTNDHLKECFKELHTQLSACLDCHNETTRLVSVKVMLKLMQVCKGSIDVEVLHVIYPEVLKRMDDSSNEIRIITTKAIAAFFNALPHNYDKEFFKLHLEFIFKTMLLHLDDQDENVQEACLDCLKEGAIIHPGLLKQQVEDVMHKHRRKRLCEELSKLCTSLLQKYAGVS